MFNSKITFNSFKFRENVLDVYQVIEQKNRLCWITMLKEQKEGLQVIFKCKDGELRCSRVVLSLTSDYFNDQLEGRDRMGNEPVFNYPTYPKARKHFTYFSLRTIFSGGYQVLSRCRPRHWFWSRLGQLAPAVEVSSLRRKIRLEVLVNLVDHNLFLF